MAKRGNPRLEEYRRKRDFTVTSEPAPEAPFHKATGPRPMFMIHKHDATRLHYDLRLEMDGALASWAIPKGPSYDPAQKRLAVQTEDHPLEYGNFEGRIPDGEYGGGDSIIWERGTYDTVPPGQASEQRKRGRLTIALDGEKLKGIWHLVRTRPIGGKQQWLCFKASDETANPDYDVVAERPESVVSGRRVTRGPVRLKTLRGVHPGPDALLKKVWPPMRALLSEPDRAPPSEYFYEVKYDGYRGLAAVSGGKVTFLTRNGLDLSGRFPEIARALARLRVGEAVFDGEVVALDKKGTTRFELLMSGAEERYALFDLLWLDGEDLRKRPVEDRRELLQSVLSNVPPPLELAELVKADSVEEALAEAKARGLEGVVAKRRGSPYLSGSKGSEWLKLKVNANQELAIAGYLPIKTGEKAIGALVLAYYEDGAFHYAGKVGTGYTAKLRKELLKLLAPDRTDEPQMEDAPRMRDAVWVKPRYVAQVAFTEWTADNRLRHPAFQGLRMDKKPEECTRERPSALKKTRAKAKATRDTGARRAPQKLAARTATAAPKKKSAEHVALTSADRVLFPKDGYTKADVYAYYGAVAEVMLRALAGRPLALQQWPQGIHKPGFFRHQMTGVPEWVTQARVDHGPRTLEHVVADRPETLLWLANQSALTLHMWSSRVEHLEEPDWVVFDLDPAHAGDKAALVTVARTLKGLLDELGLVSVPKTSGKRGLHVFVPMARGHTHRDAVDFAAAVTQVLERGLPKLCTTERSLDKRGGRLYLDAFQNGRGKTVVAPYALRACDGAPVSAPLRWSEVTEDLDPRAFNLKTMPRRLEQVGDLFAPALKGVQRLPRFRP